MKYRTIYADPPWMESGGGKIKRGADRHYPLMTNKQIIDMSSFINEIAYEDSHLYLWVTNNFLKIGLDVMEAWGYRYVTTITWMKAEYVGQLCLPLDGEESVEWTADQVGLGQYFRGVTEHCLFGVRGHCEYKVSGGKRQQGKTGFLSRRTEHSVKPDDMRRMVEAVSHGPYIELFARRRYQGWDAWGNQV